MFQPPCSKTFPLRSTARYCQSSTELPSSDHCIYKGITKSPTCIGSLFIRTSHEKKLQDDPRHRELHPILALPLCGSYQEIVRLVLQLVTPRLALYLTRHPRRLLLQLLSKTLPPKTRQDTKQQYRHQASPSAASLEPTSSKNSRLAPKDSAGCVASYSCLVASRALPVLPAAPPRHRPGASTQSSDLHTIQFCHLTACRDLA